MKILRWAAPALFYSAVLVGCSQPETESSAGNLGSATVATVNGRPILESVLRTYALTVESRSLDELSAEDREHILNDLIGLALLVEQAEKDGLLDSRALAARIELQRLQLIAREAATEYVAKNPASDAEIRAIYEENLPRLSGQQFKARHILVESRTEADSVIEELRGGADFLALARERADGPTGPNGGALDWFTLDTMPSAFATAVQGMAVGAYSSEPVQTEFGFHVILLEDRQQQEPPALDEIREQLTSAAGRQRLDDYMRMLREAATITFGP